MCSMWRRSGTSGSEERIPVKRIDRTFSALATQNRKGFIPYIMGGDGGFAATFEHFRLLEECGADIIELGVPFSDPLADGPVIQRAAERALAAGATLGGIIAFVREIRARSETPIVLMTYYNPVYKYGEMRFAEEAVSAGVDGVIIPDLPCDEATLLRKAARRLGLDTIFLAAPTSTGTRLRAVAAASSGFIYYVSMTGITGARLDLDEDFKAHMKQLKTFSRKPVAVGFGVSSPADASMIAGVADGVIVGSAIVRKLHEQHDEAASFIRSLRRAIDGFPEE